MYLLKRGFLLLPLLVLLQITTAHAQLKANFSVAKAKQCKDSAFSFTDASTITTGSITSRTWYFGDATSTTGTTASKTYTNAGTYTVSLVVTGTGGQKDSVTQKVTANPVPTASFVTSGSLCERNEIQFKSTSTASAGISKVTWKFSDGPTVYSGDSVPKTFSSPSTYSVTMTVYSKEGCTSTLTSNIVIKKTPKAVISVKNRCQDSSLTFDATGSDVSGLTIGGYVWSFPDGTTQNGSVVTKKFAGPGVYQVKLRIINSTNAGCDENASTSVTVYSNPIPNITIRNTCADSVAFLIDSSYSTFGSIVSWSWDFGHGSGSTRVLNYNYQHDTLHAFPGAGTYNVKLVMRTRYGCTTTVNRSVTIYDLPKPAFTVKNTCEDSVVQFTDASSATPAVITSWRWKWGDGTPNGTGKNPTHIYSKPGVYDVVMYGSTKYGCTDSVTKKLTINSKPKGKFTFNPKCQGVAAEFYDVTTYGLNPDDSAMAWRWDFGDGSAIDTRQNPTHAFAKYGTYKVTMVAYTYKGCGDTVTQNVEVYPPTTPDFSYTGKCELDSLQFTDMSTAMTGDTVKAWFWQFGDGNTSRLKNPKYAYSSDGDFTVTLTSSTQRGCQASISKKITIIPTPRVDFAFTPVCKGRTVTFTDKTVYKGSGAITSWKWNFDGLGSSSSQNPTFTFNDDLSHLVTLTVSGANGCTYSASKVVVVSPLPKADFTTANNCSDSVIKFFDASTVSVGNIKGWNWSFGDGQFSTDKNPTHRYATHGTWSVKLVITTTAGCQDSIEKPLTTYPKPEAKFSWLDDCADKGIQFVDETTVANGSITNYLWDFGDGSPLETAQSPKHIYKREGGSFNVRMIAFTNYGCPDTMEATVVVYPLPNASFFANPSCEKRPYTFTDNTQNNGGVITTGYEWDYGDGTPRETGKTVTHNYDTAGNYTLTLIVTTDKGCRDSVKRNIVVYPLPDIRFTYKGFCEGEDFTFYDSTKVDGGIERRQWDLGNGSKPSTPNPATSYTTPGEYRVSLEVKATNGLCSESDTITIRVYPKPEPKFVAADVCLGAPTIFMDSSTVDFSVIDEYRFIFGDGKRGTFKKGDVLFHIYDQPGTYDVKFTVYSDKGCSKTYDGKVKVLPKPTAGFMPGPLPVTIVNPEVTFKDSSFNAVKWYWSFGDNEYSTDKSPVHTYSDTGYYNVIQVVTNSQGCTDTSRYRLLVSEKFSIYSPTAFSPNDDGVNDTWLPQGAGFSRFMLKIVDRWGQVVFTSEDPNKPWDGKYNGKRVPEGVYFYHIQATDAYETEWKKDRGSITVFY